MVVSKVAVGCCVKKKFYCTHVNEEKSVAHRHFRVVGRKFVACKSGAKGETTLYYITNFEIPIQERKVHVDKLYGQ